MEQTNYQPLKALDKPRMVSSHDFEQIQDWCIERKLPRINSWAFSDTGFIVDRVACGFLYKTNSGIGMLDLFISNPHAKSPDVFKAINLIIINLIDLAKIEGCQMLSFDTKFRSIERLGKRFHFTNNGLHKSFSRLL